MNFKIIKTTEWKSSSGEKGCTHTLAYKGRVFNLTDTDFESDDFEVKNNLLSLKTKVDIVKESYVNQLGETKVGLKIKPTLGDLNITDV